MAFIPSVLRKKGGIDAAKHRCCGLGRVVVEMALLCVHEKVETKRKQHNKFKGGEHGQKEEGEESWQIYQRSSSS